MTARPLPPLPQAHCRHSPRRRRQHRRTSSLCTLAAVCPPALEAISLRSVELWREAVGLPLLGSELALGVKGG